MLDVFCYLLDELRCNEIRLRRVKYSFAMWNSFAVKYLLRKCEKGEFHFTSSKARYFTISARKLFHIRHKPNISLFPSTSVIAILKSPLISTFTSSKNTKPRWLNSSNTIIKRCESTSSLVSEWVQITLRAFCEKQNRVHSTTSVDVKLASSICFNQRGRFNF